MGLRPRIKSTHEDALTHPAVRALVSAADSAHDPTSAEVASFDLAFVPPLFNEVGYHLADRLNASLVLLMPSVANNLLTSAMGYFDNPSFATSSVYERGQFVTPSFVERFIPFLLHNFYGPIKRALFTSDMEELIRKHVPRRQK